MKRVIFDTDIGIDDAMALLFLHYAEAVQLEAICTVSGNASISDVTRNALYVCERFGIDVPVHRGAGGPLGPALTKDHPDFVHGRNGLGNLRFDKPRRRAKSVPAAEAIVRLARENPGELSLVAVGRLTNVALALNLCPELPELLKELIVMGGVFFRAGHGGNVSPVAEANMGGDPAAADEVFASGIATTIVGLDVTQETTMDEDFVGQLRESAGDAGQFIYDITRFYLDFYEGVNHARRCPIHDSSAVACLLAPELYDFEKGPVRVVTEGIAMGQSILGEHPERYAIDAWRDRPSCKVAVAVKGEKVKALYLKALARAADGA